jgi:hypothetical protein
MKRTLVVLVVALLAGCMSAPMSSVSSGARPSHTIENGDGTTTFEFLFPYDNTWDKSMALQRVDEYLATYTRVNGFSGYNAISVATQLLSRIPAGSAGLDILASAAGGASNDTAQPEQAKYVRVMEQVRFRT